jgi:glycosyltransferase involved in cell wall biosynthesis
MSHPRVSVAMVAYNHEAFLTEAIESVLAQEYGDWDLVIGEDHSTDRTRSIAERFEREHPDRIRVLRDEKHLGGRHNYVRTLRACRGEFVAQLDGDDFWTSPRKLTKQVAFLDAHPDCAWCFHTTQELRQAPKRSTHNLDPPGRRERYDLQDLLWANFVGSASVLWRRPHTEQLPAWFWEVPVGDWPMHVMCAQRGWIGYIDEVMCAHRIHTRGAFVGMAEAAQVRQRLEIRRYLAAHLGEPVADTVAAADLRDHFRLAKACRREGQVGVALRELGWCFSHRIRGQRPRLPRLGAEWLRVVLRGTVPPARWRVREDPGSP